MTFIVYRVLIYLNNIWFIFYRVVFVVAFVVQISEQKSYNITCLFAMLLLINWQKSEMQFVCKSLSVFTILLIHEFVDVLLKLNVFFLPKTICRHISRYIQTLIKFTHDDNLLSPMINCNNVFFLKKNQIKANFSSISNHHTWNSTCLN